MQYDINPFANICSERESIWQMLVYRDIDAFLAAEWSITEPDFKSDGFFGLDTGGHENPDAWNMKFSDLAAYKNEWLRQANETQATADMANARKALFAATDLSQIEITDGRALAHKKFNGEMPLITGGADLLNWQTLYICEKHGSAWKISSFIGYMKYEAK